MPRSETAAAGSDAAVGSMDTIPKDTFTLRMISHGEGDPIKRTVIKSEKPDGNVEEVNVHVVQPQSNVNLDNIDTDLGKISGLTTEDTKANILTSTGVVHMSTLPTNSVNRMTGVPLTLPHGSNVVTVKNNQIILRPASQLQHVSSVAQIMCKRPMGATVTSGQGQAVTKVIITKNPDTNETEAVPTGVIASRQYLNAPQNQPTKIVTLSQTFNPSHRILTAPTTPTKQIRPSGKLPISPLKGAQQRLMVPLELVKSPSKGVPQMFTMLGKSLISTVSTQSSSTMTHASKPQTLTLSPSKVLVRGQAVSLAGHTSLVGQQFNTITNRAAAPTTVSSSIQPMTVAGNKFQYVRLVTTPTTQSQVLRHTSLTPTATVSNNRPVLSVAPTATPIRMNLPTSSQPQLKPRPTALIANQSQRLILPATSQRHIRPSLQPVTSLAQIRPTPVAGVNSGVRGSTLANLPPGTTIIPSGQNMSGVQGFALVPAQYVSQLQQQFLPSKPEHASGSSSSSGSYIPISSSNAPPASQTKSTMNGRQPPVENTSSSANRQRKPCNCTKSQCLKLYCDCFANGEFCYNCNCINCSNNLGHEEERSRSIKSCLERNPHAFHPKIGKGKNGEGERRHNKGCNCKRSGCLKNYCECYEAKILCSSLCKCVGCKNYEESSDRKTLMHLADAAEVRVQQQTAATTKLSSQIQDLPSRPPLSASGERLPFTFITTDVAEATCACLVAQTEEAERTRQIEVIQERMILQEFGRCLMQVIESANRTKLENDPSPVP